MGRVGRMRLLGWELGEKLRFLEDIETCYGVDDGGASYLAQERDGKRSGGC